MSKASLTREADRIFGEMFHRKYKVCCVEGCTNPCEMAHLIPRGNKLFRWLWINALPICSYHHKESKLMSCHGSPEAWEDWLKQNHPDRWVFLMQNRHITGVSLPLPYFKEIVESLKQEQLKCQT